MRQALRSSTVHVHAIVAAVLALGLVLGIAALAWAAPSVSIDSGPTGPTNDPMPSFGFTVDASATTVECSIDQGTPAYGPCSGVATDEPDAPLPDGDYVFRVRATDDQLQQTEATQSFTVDTSPPSLSIDSGPSGATNDATPSFGFTAEPDATVECSVDQGTPAYGSCTSGTTDVVGASLPDGDYVFRVRATDAAGNEAVLTRSFTVDTTPPSLSIDSGPSGATNDATPSFGFTAGLDATTVECSIDQGAPAYVPCPTGTPYSEASQLADGSYVFRVRATDALGNEAVKTRSFSVDTTPPSLSIDSGPSGATNDATPSFGFTAGLDATTVECSIDQGAPAYVPCPTGTPYSEASQLADGSYVFRVRATDALGNEAVKTRSFSVDTTPPSLSIDSGPSGATNDATPSFGFTAGLDATTVECSVDQGTPAYGSCTSGTTEVVGASLPDGDYVFRVRATDALGNEALMTRSFSVDATPPSLLIDSGPAGPTNDATPSFGFTAGLDATTVECSIDQGTPTYGPCTTPTSHTAASPLADGSYVFHVRATDALGNQAVASQSFSVDSAAPSLSIDSGPAGPTNDATPSFGFTVEPGATVECSVDQGTPAYGSCTSGTTDIVGTPLAEGTWTFRVRATSAVGNHAIVSRTFTVDTTPPSLSIGFGPSGTTSDNTPLFGFSAEAGATVACSIDQGAPAYRSCASATTDAAFAPLADGAYVFRVRATDAAGNVTVATRSFTVDTAPPAPDPGSPRPDPTPPVTPPVTSPATPTPSGPQLLSPFPLVRISGTLTATGARIRLLSVRAPRGALVRVAVTPACSKKSRSSRRCRVLRAAATVGRSDSVAFRRLARAYRSGTVIVVRVWRADRIGKYTRFTIVHGKAPVRLDQCLLPAATRGSRCPSD